jgi:N-acetylglucosamine-6-phosphate deacetylase
VILLTGAEIVLPDGLTGPSTLFIEGARIADIVPGTRKAGHSDVAHDLTGRLVAPGFIDVHVHGVEGFDSLSRPDAIAEMARRLVKFGVTAFCPTSVACEPAALRAMLDAVRAARVSPAPRAARVLPAHLESNFVNPEFAGAQPLDCLRRPSGGPPREGRFTGADILQEIERARPDVGIVTLAPELEGGLPLVAALVSAGHRVSIGHSGATYEEASAAIDAGVRHATHLFNRMTPMGHRAPGVVGAVLSRAEVAAELVCDGVHVHPAVMRAAIGAKGVDRTMAITDGTAGSGLAPGSQTVLGGRPIWVRDTARLGDGTIAGSVLTMDVAFERLVTRVGLSPVEASILCSTTPARELELHGHGTVATGAVADLVILDRQYRVVQSWVNGELAWSEDRLLDRELK